MADETVSTAQGSQQITAVAAANAAFGPIADKTADNDQLQQKAIDNIDESNNPDTNGYETADTSQAVTTSTTPPSSSPSLAAKKEIIDAPQLSTPEDSEEITDSTVVAPKSNSESSLEQKQENSLEQQPSDQKTSDESHQPNSSTDENSESEDSNIPVKQASRSTSLTIDTSLRPQTTSMLDVNTPLSATPNKIVGAQNTSSKAPLETFQEQNPNENSEDQEYRDIARKLFNEDFVSIQPEEYTQFLAASDSESSRIREYYMDLFRWDSNLLKSTRTLCSKLYLKGESQEIDRILSSFTKSYIKQHPVNVFCTRNFEKIYIVLYSLILLNTALHNSELNKKSKISQTDYIRNTFTTFIQQNPKSSKKLSIKQRIIIERELSNYYEDLLKNELHLKKSDEFNNNGQDFNLSAATKNSSKSKRMSVAETIRSIPSSTNQSSHSAPSSGTAPTSYNSAAVAMNGAPNQQLASNMNNSSMAGSPQTIQLPPQTQNHDPNFYTPTESEFPALTRQLSDTSIWSTDTANQRRSSLAIKRMPSATSGVSQYTANNTNNSTTSSRTTRVGFTRALASDNKFYQNPNVSRTSSTAGTPYSLRNRQSLDQLRGMPSYQNGVMNNVTPSQSHNAGPGNSAGNNASLNRRSSRASVISKESTSSVNNDDSMSVLSFDTVHMNNLDIDDLDDKDKVFPQQGLEEFNVDDYQDHYDLTLELQGSPYLKEGLLKLKILNNDQQDSNVSETIQPPSSAASTASGANGGGSRGFFSFFTNKLSSSHGANNYNQNIDAAAAAAAATATHTGTNSSSLLPNRFNESFVVVSKGELALYSFDPKIIKKHQQKLRKLKQKQIVPMIDEEEDEEDEIKGDGNWLKNAANIGSYNLCSTYAQLEKHPGSTHSGSIAKKTIYWSLTFPKVSKKQPKKFIFEAGTREIALEFVNTCNFWASKITAIPTLEESVSSIEYGWTNLDGLIHRRDGFKKAKYIQKWEPLPRGVYLSNYIVANNGLDNEANHLGMMKQFVKTLKYYNNLKQLYNDFNQSKIKFLKNFKQYAQASNYKVIITNYENKVMEYKSELNKYKTYLIILGFGLQLRFDLEQQDREAAIMDQLETDETLKDKDINEEATKLFMAQYEQDSELTQLVKFEIRKLFTSLKDVSKVIPTFQSSRSINNLIELTKHHQQQYAYYPSYHPHQHPANADPNDEQNRGFSLVKSPKTFTLSNYNDNESPINQLLQTIDGSNNLNHANNNDLLPSSYSTNTIKEEEEPEESDDTKINTPIDTVGTTKQTQSRESLQPSHVLK